MIRQQHRGAQASRERQNSVREARAPSRVLTDASADSQMLSVRRGFDLASNTAPEAGALPNFNLVTSRPARGVLHTNSPQLSLQSDCFPAGDAGRFHHSFNRGKQSDGHLVSIRNSSLYHFVSSAGPPGVELLLRSVFPWCRLVGTCIADLQSACGVRTFLVPEGPLETSPRFQPWVPGTENRSSPEGTAEVHSHK